MTRTITILTLLIVGLWVLIEAHYPEENPRHRHRHRHEAYKAPGGRKADETEDEGEEENEDYYRARSYQGRLEPRHRSRFHVNSRHAQNPWQKVEDIEQRRRNARNKRGHKTRLWTYPGRNHDLEDDDSTEDMDYDDYDSSRLDQERAWRTFRRSDYEYRNWLHSRRDWMRKIAQDRRRKVNHYFESRARFPFANYDDYNDDDWDVDSWSRDRFRKSNSTNATPEDDSEDDDEYDNDDVFDNDFFKEDDAPYKTYDDIIKRLTSDDPTTKSSVKRGYRNIEIENRRREGNAKNLQKNTGKVNARYTMSLTDQKMSNVISSVDQKKEIKSQDLQGRSRGSGEVDDDDDYLNSDDKAMDIQADVTNGYADDESSTEDETSAPLATLPVTTTSTTTTSTTTTTPKPAITTQAYDRRDSRLYNTTGSHNTVSLIHHVRNIPKSQHQPPKNGKSAEIREALQHAIKVSREGSCQWPRVRVIPVKDVYPSPVTTYIPHCAILHRCSDDTGCCRSETHTCVPKQSHKIELSFYTTSYRGVSVVEKLSFYNHTECECREKSEYGMTSDSKVSGQEGNEYRSLATRQQQHQSVIPPQNMRRPPQRKPCKCPYKFKPRITLEGVCECYCAENNQDCINLRRGIGQITLQEEVCIDNNECTTPPCDFGNFIHLQRRCPRKKERFHAISSYSNHMHHHPRLRNQR